LHQLLDGENLKNIKDLQEASVSRGHDFINIRVHPVLSTQNSSISSFSAYPRKKIANESQYKNKITDNLIEGATYDLE
jgi:hypothetical protein